MIQLLSRLFIKDHKNTAAPKVRQAYGILSGAVGIFLNLQIGRASCRERVFRAV